jgi:catalase-peroxidase
VIEIKDDKTNTQAHHMTGKCPFGGDRIGGSFGAPPTLSDWYPNRLKIELLHHNGPQANPLGDKFDYAAAFNKIDFVALKKDIKSFLTSSVAWWPSDYGNYGPQMIRMAWHAAGTYRIADGRGGAGEALQRFAPINSWWDNGNTDKSRRLIWPIKQKYGAALSWGDLMVLTGNCALEIMGFPTYGFGGGRRDAWEADTSTYWGPEVWDPKDVSSFDSMVTRDKRWRGQNGDADYDLENPLAATHQALIYVNPEGPYANGDPMGSARDIRIAFTRMAMNDEETVALIAGGHAFGKSHGRRRSSRTSARDCADRGYGTWLAEPGRHGLCRIHDDKRHRRQLDSQSDPMGQQLSGKPVQVRMEANEESGRRITVDPHRPGCAQDARRTWPRQDEPADDDDQRYRTEDRP